MPKSCIRVIRSITHTKPYVCAVRSIRQTFKPRSMRSCVATRSCALPSACVMASLRRSYYRAEHFRSNQSPGTISLPARRNSMRSAPLLSYALSISLKARWRAPCWCDSHLTTAFSFSRFTTSSATVGRWAFSSKKLAISLIDLMGSPHSRRCPSSTAITRSGNARASQKVRLSSSVRIGKNDSSTHPSFSIFQPIDGGPPQPPVALNARLKYRAPP